MKPQYVVFDGIIGAGKSTLIQRLMEDASAFQAARIAHIEEPVESWKSDGILQKSYEEPTVWNFPAQCHFFHTRIMGVRQAVAANPETPIFFGERSPFTDQIFWNVQLQQNRLADPKLHAIYMNMWSMWNELMPLTPTLFVYLNPSLETCMQRMYERGRQCEKEGVSVSYQQTLLNEHEKVFAATHVKLPSGEEVPVLHIKTDDNFRDDDACLEKIATQIKVHLT